MEEHHGQNDEGQQVVERIEPVEGRIADGKSAPQQGDDALADPRDRREQIGDHSGRPVAHLAPRQHVSHKGGRNHQYQNHDTEYPQQFARLLVRAVIKSAEQMDVDDREEHRRPVHMGVAQHPAEIDVAHDALDRVEGEIGVRRVLHREHNAGYDQHDQHDPGERAEIPPIAQIAGCRVIVQLVLQHPDKGQPVIDPAYDPAAGAGAGNIGHACS